MGAGGQRRREPTLRGRTGPHRRARGSSLFANGARSFARGERARLDASPARAREVVRERAPSNRRRGRRSLARRVLRPRTLEARRSHGSAKRCSRRLARERKESVARIFSTAAARAGSLSHVACSDLSLLTVHGRRCGPSRDRSMLSAHATTCGRRSHLLCFDHEMSSCAPWARNCRAPRPVVHLDRESSARRLAYEPSGSVFMTSLRARCLRRASGLGVHIEPKLDARFSRLGLRGPVLA